MAKNHFYVVWKGRETGIFSSWEECKKQINGFEGAQYKGFPTELEARAASEQSYWIAIKNAEKPKRISWENTELTEKPNVQSISVDAACSGNPGKMEYRGVETATGRQLFHQGPFESGTNNIGEFLALVHGLAMLKQNNSDLPIYSDSATAIAWVRAKKCRTKLEQNAKNEVLFDLIVRAEKWLKENTYNNKILKWKTEMWGEIPADFGRK
jgi:ribonuclease HI